MVIRHGKKIFPASLHTTLLQMLVDQNVSRDLIMRMIHNVYESLDDGGVGICCVTTKSNSGNNNSHNNNSNAQVSSSSAKDNVNSSEVACFTSSNTNNNGSSSSSSPTASVNNNVSTTNGKGEIKEYKSNDRFRVLQALLRYHQ
uniref:Uncharacterized protein n=1 Tax=Lygus hesperus TaxID=30085 RepID=A0A0A9ZF03_LYGHE